jgi:hypothetical protein
MLGILVLAVAASSAVASETPVDYDRDVRPILSEHCFACHGPDEAARKADLRLDQKADALADRDDGAAVVPGDPESSNLVFRVEVDDSVLRMPPAKFKKPLTREQKDTLRQWVAQGAEWSKHWAFSPPKRPEVPGTSNPGWVRTPVDAFILGRLDREHLRPSPEASRETLIRRLSLDLIGLPPSIEEVDAFLADTGPGAYDRLVERLLASPHYGERWGRLWLDAARYADSDGYEKDKPRNVWAYRDYVINSLNHDLPYDQFIIEQVAGDLLDDPTTAQMVATGYLRNSMVNEEGGVDPEQFRMEASDVRPDGRHRQGHSGADDPVRPVPHSQV